MKAADGGCNPLTYGVVWLLTLGAGCRGQKQERSRSMPVDSVDIAISV